MKKRTWKYRNPRSGRYSQDRRLVGYFILIFGVGCALILSFVGINTIIHKIEDKLQSFSEVIVVENAEAKEPQNPLTWQEQVMQTLKEYGINTKKADKIIQCESGWNTHATHQNKGSVDRGLWQINSVAHPEVSNTCAFNSDCSTIEAIRIIKTAGWDAWVCNRL